MPWYHNRAMIIKTQRLHLRPMLDDDMEPFLAMVTDHDAMRYVSPEPILRADAERAAAHYRAMLDNKGYGYWTIEINGGATFAGIILLQDVKFAAAFAPAVEVGWLLPREHWGNGYATEGGEAALDYAFDTLKLEEVVAVTTMDNFPSQRVMQRLGMTRDPLEDFVYPGTSIHCMLYRAVKSK